MQQLTTGSLNRCHGAIYENGVRPRFPILGASNDPVAAPRRRWGRSIGPGVHARAISTTDRPLAARQLACRAFPSSGRRQVVGIYKSLLRRNLRKRGPSPFWGFRHVFGLGCHFRRLGSWSTNALRARMRSIPAARAALIVPVSTCETNPTTGRPVASRHAAAACSAFSWFKSTIRCEPGSLANLEGSRMVFVSTPSDLAVAVILLRNKRSRTRQSTGPGGEDMRGLCQRGVHHSWDFSGFGSRALRINDGQSSSVMRFSTGCPRSSKSSRSAFSCRICADFSPALFISSRTSFP